MDVQLTGRAAAAYIGAWASAGNADGSLNASAVARDARGAQRGSRLAMLRLTTVAWVLRSAGRAGRAVRRRASVRTTPRGSAALDLPRPDGTG